MEITDEVIKKKHKEFNERISRALNLKQGNNGQKPQIADRLRQVLARRQPKR